ncbi:MAG: type II toxin-antitoxin system RelE/ParE family toxin, partial [Sulfuricellaceae bacterium]
MSYQVKELLLPDGKSPYAEWFATLDPVTAAKIGVVAARMEQGNLSNVEWFRGIGEYKIDWGPGYRIYLARDGLKIIVLLGGGNKKRQQQDIDQAVSLWEGYILCAVTICAFIHRLAGALLRCKLLVWNSHTAQFAPCIASRETRLNPQ